MPSYQRVTIVGAGLIGGSIGLALRERRLASEVVAVGRRPESLERAVKRGAVDRTTTDLNEGVSQADLVVVATPVEAIVDAVAATLRAAPDAVVTDAGSVKREICRQIRRVADQENLRRAQFVGSHPLAGDHRSGPEHARGDLLEGRTVVVAAQDDDLPEVVAIVQQFWEALGAKAVALSPEEHDRALAATSHLPHLVAAALAGVTPREWLPLAATGWADTTRIGAADPGLWMQIFRQNRGALLEALHRFEERIEALGDAVENGEDQKVITLLSEAKQTRDALGD